MVQKSAPFSSWRNEYLKVLKSHLWLSFSFINQWWHLQIQELPSTSPKCTHTIKQNKRCSIPESQLCTKPPDDILEHYPEMYTPVATSLRITFKQTTAKTEVIKVHQDLAYQVYYHIKILSGKILIENHSQQLVLMIKLFFMAQKIKV